MKQISGWATCGVAVAAMVFATTAWAGGAGLYEMGTPDMGTAAAGRAAMASDASTSYGNPAGMTRLADSQMLAGVMPYWVQMFFDAQSASESGGNGGNAGGFSPLPSWGGWMPGLGLFGVYSISDDWKLGFSVNAPVGGSADYDSNWAGRYYVQRADLLTLNFNPSLAYRVTPWLSLGAGFSVQYAKIVQKAAINNVLDPGIGDGRITIRDDTVGFGGNAGVLVEPMAGTRFGVTYRSQVDQDFDNVASLENVGPGLKAILDGRNLTGSSVDMDLTIPQEVMVSGYQELTPTVAIMGNFGWQNWNQFGKPTLTVNDTSLTADENYDDTFHGALGLQFRITDPFLMSMGFAYDTAAVSDAHRSPAAAMDEQFRYALGLQYDWSKAFTLGLAWELLDQKSSPIDKSSRYAGTLQGDYSTFLINFVNLNIIWRL